MHRLDGGRHRNRPVRRTCDTVVISKRMDREQARVHHDERLANGGGKEAVEQADPVVRADARVGAQTWTLQEAYTLASESFDCIGEDELRKE